MTQASEVHERLSQLDSSDVMRAPRSTTQTRTFAFTFGIAFTLLYTVYERLNWPLFTWQPAVGKMYFWLHRPLSGEGPPMYWYGWLFLGIPAALVVASAATLVPRERPQQATFFCCTLAILWPIALALASLFTDQTSFNEQWATFA